MVSLKLRRIITLALLFCLASASAATVWRIVSRHQSPGPFDPSNQGFCDFQNGVYFPALAFGRGVSPYSQEYARSYPVERSIPFFSPVALALHWPFSLFQLQLAETIYGCWLALMVAGISCFVISDLKGKGSIGRLNEWLSVALVIVVSRSGQQTLFTGYFTLELILASIVAVRFGGQRPWLSALALVIVSAKPNYVLPIGILMLARGHWRSVLAGGILSAGLASICFAWIWPEGGAIELLQQIASSQEIHRLDPIERPINTWIRVDLLAIIAKWLDWDPGTASYLLVMTCLLLPAGMKLSPVVFRLSKGEANLPPKEPDYEAERFKDGFLLLTSVVVIYHHVYDVLLIISFLVWLIFRPCQVNLPVATRYLIVGCLLFPLLNYATSQMVLQKFGVEGMLFQVVTSLNAISLVVAWLVMLFNIPGTCSNQAGSNGT